MQIYWTRCAARAMADPDAKPATEFGFRGAQEAYAELLKHYQRALKQEAIPRDALTEAAREATLALEKLYKS